MKVVDQEINAEYIRALVDGNVVQGAMYLYKDDIVSPFISEAVETINSTVKSGSHVLIIGGGTYTIPRYIRQDINVDVIEINPKMFDIAVEYFWYKPTSNIYHLFADASRYNLERNKYNMIIVDVHDSKDVPEYFRSKQFYKRLSKLTPRVIVNEYSHTEEPDFDYYNYNVVKDKELQPKELGSWHFKELIL